MKENNMIAFSTMVSIEKYVHEKKAFYGKYSTFFIYNWNT